MGYSSCRSGLHNNRKSRPDLTSLRKIFPHIHPSALKRPCGQVELLLGACDGRLLPFGGMRVGNLRLENTPWREGQVL